MTAHVSFMGAEEQDLCWWKVTMTKTTPPPKPLVQPVEHSLLDAAKLGDVAEVLQLLQEGAQLNKTDMYGWTALHFAAGKGHHEVLQLLLARGAYVNHPDHDGLTPLHVAVWSQQPRAVQVLLEQGANPHAPMCGRPPAKVARERGDAAILSLLAAHGACAC